MFRETWHKLEEPNKYIDFKALEAKKKAIEKEQSESVASVEKEEEWKTLKQEVKKLFE